MIIRFFITLLLTAMLAGNCNAAPGDKISAGATAFTNISGFGGKAKAGAAKDTIKIQGEGATTVSVSSGSKTVTVSSPAQVNSDWESTMGVSQIFNKPPFLSAIDQSLATTATPAFPGLKLGTASYDTAVITQQSGGGLSFTSPPNDPQVNGISYIFNAKSWNDNSAGKALQIQRSSTPLVTVNGNGNVGIGTTNPTAQLQLNDGNGPNGTNKGISIYGGGTNQIVNFEYANVFFGNRTDSGSSGAKISALIGPNPGSRNYETQLAFFTSDGSGSSVLSEAMRIVNNGNIGIGTTSPQTKLDVAGDANISGTLTATTINSPSIPDAQVQSDWTAFGTIAEILNKPEIPIACVNVYDGRDGGTGATGPTGATGSPGADGKTVLSGSGAPASGLGVNGDFYVDTANAHFYGPKAAGAWPETYIELVGPQGPAGPEGPPGALPNQAAIFGVIDDPVDGATMWLQQGDPEQATNAKDGVKDRLGNAKTWRDGNGTVVRQCIAGDSAPAFKMLDPGGAVIYSLACDNTMTFTGTVIIK